MRPPQGSSATCDAPAVERDAHHRSETGLDATLAWMVGQPTTVFTGLPDVTDAACEAFLAFWATTVRTHLAAPGGDAAAATLEELLAPAHAAAADPRQPDDGGPLAQVCALIGGVASAASRAALSARLEAAKPSTAPQPPLRPPPEEGLTARQRFVLARVWHVLGWSTQDRALNALAASPWTPPDVRARIRALTAFEDTLPAERLLESLRPKLAQALAPRYRLGSMVRSGQKITAQLGFRGGRTVGITLHIDGRGVAKLGRLWVSYVRGELADPRLAAAIAADVARRWHDAADLLAVCVDGAVPQRLIAVAFGQTAASSPESRAQRGLQALARGDFQMARALADGAFDPERAPLGWVVFAALEAGSQGDVERVSACEDRLVRDPATPPGVLAAILSARGAYGCALQAIHVDTADAQWSAVRRAVFAAGDAIVAGPKLAEAPPTDELLDDASGWPGALIVASRPDLARRWLQGVEQSPELRRHARVWLRRMALWEGQLDAAEGATDTLAERRVALGIAVMKRDLSDAQRRVAELVNIADDDAEVLTWAAEIAHIEGRHAEACELADRAGQRLNHWPARLVMGLAYAAEQQDALGDEASEELFGGAVDGLFTDELSQVSGVVASTLSTGPSEQWSAPLAELHALLGGNRSGWPIGLSADGTLGPLDAPAHCRQLAGDLQRELATAPVDALLARYDALSLRFPASPHPWTFRGELMLWAGRYDEAQSCFERALAVRDCRWGYVGTAAAHLMRGQVDAAQAAFDRLNAIYTPVARATTPVYLGILAKLRGDLPQAATHFATATDEVPARIGAWVERGLVALDLGEPALAETCLTELTARCPALAARTDSHRTVRERLNNALALLAGNRASRLITILDEDGLHLLPRPDAFRRAAADVLRHASAAPSRSAPCWVPGQDSNRRAGEPLVDWRRDPELLARYETHGWIQLPNAISDGRLQRWRRAARAGIRLPMMPMLHLAERLQRTIVSVDTISGPRRTVHPKPLTAPWPLRAAAAPTVLVALQPFTGQLSWATDAPGPWSPATLVVRPGDVLLLGPDAALEGQGPADAATWLELEVRPETSAAGATVDA